MTEEVKKDIKKRKELNRQWRNENREREKLIWERYKEQIIKARQLINEIRKHKKKMLKKLKKIREGKSFGKI